jgi:predicted nucleic acid-binding protein
MRLYLDMCSLQRPLDTKTQLRIIVEAQAILGIISLCQSSVIELISSDALLFEAKKISIPERKTYVFEVLSQASIFIARNNEVEEKAREFVTFGIKPMDALHLASAIVGDAKYFCTCDDRLLRRAKTLNNLATLVVSPAELIMEVN